MTSDPQAVQWHAAMFKVLGDPKRLQILYALLERPHRVCELVDTLDLEQSLVSHHLQTMRDAGLVVAERSGRQAVYRLAPETASRFPAQRRQDTDLVDLGCCTIVFRRPPQHS